MKNATNLEIACEVLRQNESPGCSSKGSLVLSGLQPKFATQSASSDSDMGLLSQSSTKGKEIRKQSTVAHRQFFLL